MKTRMREDERLADGSRQFLEYKGLLVFYLPFTRAFRPEAQSNSGSWASVWQFSSE